MPDRNYKGLPLYGERRVLTSTSTSQNVCPNIFLLDVRCYARSTGTCFRIGAQLTDVKNAPLFIVLSPDEAEQR